jgi:hypothetical protein
MSKWIIGCEESQTITIALRKKGIEAYSCDLLPCSGGYPEWHYQDDIFKVLKMNLGFTHGGFHPECTKLTVAANRWYLPEYSERFPNIQQERKEAIDFFIRITNNGLKHWFIENPIGIMSKLYRKPDQIIQPYYFGDTERKATCLWLHNLPTLRHSDTPTLRHFLKIKLMLNLKSFIISQAGQTANYILKRLNSQKKKGEKHDQ